MFKTDFNFKELDLLKLDVSNYAKEQYVTRFMGFNSFEESEEYLEENDLLITNHILRVLEHSDFIMTGKFSSKHVDKVYGYYMRDNSVGVVVSDNNVVVAIFPIIWKFGDDLSVKLNKEIAASVESTRKALEEASLKEKDYFKEIDEEVAKIDKEIRDMNIKISELEYELAEKRRLVKEKGSKRSHVLIKKNGFKTGLKEIEDDMSELGIQLFGPSESKRMNYTLEKEWELDK